MLPQEHAQPYSCAEFAVTEFATAFALVFLKEEGKRKDHHV